MSQLTPEELDRLRRALLRKESFTLPGWGTWTVTHHAAKGGHPPEDRVSYAPEPGGQPWEPDSLTVAYANLRYHAMRPVSLDEPHISPPAVVPVLAPLQVPVPEPEPEPVPIPEPAPAPAPVAQPANRRIWLPLGLVGGFLLALALGTWAYTAFLEREMGDYLPLSAAASTPAASVADTTRTISPPAVPPADSAFVVVVHSLPFRTLADSIALQVDRQISATGLRSIVVPAEVRGRTTYRISIGRYGTEAEAHAAAQALPAPLSSNFFITRIP